MRTEYTSRWPLSDEARERQPVTAGRGPALTRNLGGAPGAGVCIVAVGGTGRAARHYPTGGFR